MLVHVTFLLKTHKSFSIALRISSKILSDSSKAPVMWPQPIAWFHLTRLSTSFITFPSQQTASNSCLPQGSHHLSSRNTLPALPTPCPDLGLSSSYSFFKIQRVISSARSAMISQSVLAPCGGQGSFLKNNENPTLTDLNSFS